MKTNIPRIAAIHSLPSFGRSSLSVIIPVLSSMGMQVCPIPTSVLSSHTGGLGDVEKIDLDGYISACFEKYNKLGIEFDCIYSGYFGKEEQIEDLLEIYKSHKESFKAVDPVMGDSGKPYRFFTEALIDKVRQLSMKADLITPNLTESYLLLNKPFDPAPLNSSSAKSILSVLSLKGPKMVVITGATMSDGIYNIGYDRDKNTYFRIKCRYVPVSYPGTGDIFAATVVGEIMQGKSLPLACEAATRFCERSVKSTYSYSSDPRFGVMFEPYLSDLPNSKESGNYELL